MTIKAERGYLIWAIGTEYISCAEACAKSIKIHTPDANICLVTNDELTKQQGTVFDYVVPFPFPVNNDNILANDWQVYSASPFRETIKIEADMIVPHSIEHWWAMLEHKDVVLTQGSRNYLNELNTSRHYRKIFNANGLLDVYNAITYWRISRTATDFFNEVHKLFTNWEDVQQQIKMGVSDSGTTDLVYAIAAKIIGEENVTLPSTSYPTLIHMKGRHNQCHGEDWTKEMVWELDGSNIRVNTIDQQYPFHYYIKEFNKELNKYYDNIIR